jgi:hypothetical protein
MTSTTRSMQMHLLVQLRVHMRLHMGTTRAIRSTRLMPVKEERVQLATTERYKACSVATAAVRVRFKDSKSST